MTRMWFSPLPPTPDLPREEKDQIRLDAFINFKGAGESLTGEHVTSKYNKNTDFKWTKKKHWLSGHNQIVFLLPVCWTGLLKKVGGKILPTAVPGSCGCWFPGGPGFGGIEADSKWKKQNKTCCTETLCKCFYDLFYCNTHPSAKPIIFWKFLQAQIDSAGHAAQLFISTEDGNL